MLGERLLPSELDIHRKQGFSIPMDAWLRKPDKRWTDLLDCGFSNLINKSAIANLIAGHNRQWSNGARLFALIMLSISMNNLAGDSLR